jgi:hypothetical protein
MTISLNSFPCRCIILTASLLCLRADAGMIAGITSLEAKPAFALRHHQLHALSDAQLREGAQSFIQFMKDEKVPQGMHPVDYMSLVNDMFNRMLESDIAVEQIFNLSLRVIVDPSAGLVWRDYCVQKLGYTLNRDDLSTESVAKGLTVLDRVCTNEFPYLQGTALIVAFYLIDYEFEASGRFLTRSEIGRRALSCAGDADRPLIDRITGMQVAGMCRAEGCAALVESLIIQEETTPVMLKVAAMAAAGELKSKPHYALIEPYSLSPDIRLRKAASTALQRIKE